MEDSPTDDEPEIQDSLTGYEPEIEDSPMDNMANIKDSPTDEVNEIKDRSTNNYCAEMYPIPGMSFTSLDKLIEAYQSHAKLKGFLVTMRVGQKGSDGARKYQTISCDRGKK